MQVAVQYTRLTAPPYQIIDQQSVGQNQWRRLPKKLRPTITSKLDQTDGWIYSIACQGVYMTGDDCYAVLAREQAGGGVRLLSWSTQVASETGDPDDYQFRRGIVREFPPLKPDPDHGGVFNTNHSITYYAEAGAGWDYWNNFFPQAGIPLPNGNVVQRADYSTFPFPAEQDIKYGIWIRGQSMPDAMGTLAERQVLAETLYTQHEAIASVVPTKWQDSKA